MWVRARLISTAVGVPIALVRRALGALRARGVVAAAAAAVGDALVRRASGALLALGDVAAAAAAVIDAEVRGTDRTLVAADLFALGVLAAAAVVNAVQRALLSVPLHVVALLPRLQPHERRRRRRRRQQHGRRRRRRRRRQQPLGARASGATLQLRTQRMLLIAHALAPAGHRKDGEKRRPYFLQGECFITFLISEVTEKMVIGKSARTRTLGGAFIAKCTPLSSNNHGGRSHADVLGPERGAEVQWHGI